MADCSTPVSLRASSDWKPNSTLAETEAYARLNAKEAAAIEDAEARGCTYVGSDQGSPDFAENADGLIQATVTATLNFKDA